MLLTISGTGYGAHPAASQFSPAPRAPSLPWFRSLTTQAERGGLDAILFGDNPSAPPFDAMPLIAALAADNERIGLGAAVPLDHAEPFNIARSFAGADRLTAGRTAWLAGLTNPSAPAAYARAAECIEVVRKLWDSWEDEAILLDKQTGLFSDPARVHRIDHVGPFFSVRGPLNAPRPLQGHPIIIHNDSSAPGLALAAATTDLFLATTPTLDTLPALRRALGPRPAILATIIPRLAESQSQADARAAALDSLLTAAQLPTAIPFIGTPAALADHLATLFASGLCDGFHIAPAVLPTDLDLFTTHAIPRLRALGLRPAHYTGTTLREHLFLPRPRSQFAA
jgi:alkanesulfonate monooxygenase SsuD/methylene tetrahydromethanopterin reductase-like flavin-dependent oxidoreductase (luciferase family)